MTADAAPCWISPKEASVRLGVSLSLIRKAMRDGRLHPHRLRGSRLLRLRAEDVDSLFEPVPARPRLVRAGAEAAEA